VKDDCKGSTLIAKRKGKALLFKEKLRNYHSLNLWGPVINTDFLKIRNVYCKADGAIGHCAAVDVVRSMLRNSAAKEGVKGLRASEPWRAYSL
jgi:hypothetical protein